jgi:hypothetical protein
MKNIIILSILFIAINTTFSQTDSLLLPPPDSVNTIMNMDAVYNRPFLQIAQSPVAIGGYVEANSSYFGTDGVTEGLSFQIPRMTVFIASTINKKIKFLSEIELEEGGKELSIEFASVDFEAHPLLNIRGGVFMNPIGAFNQNHDGPRWEFVNRPISATTIIPSTWSNVGFGIYGKYARNNWIFGYETYISNGFDESIISNSENRTWLPESKNNKERFEESFNGSPLLTAKMAIRNIKVGEIGISWMGGVYNKFMIDGVTVDDKNRVDVVAIDISSDIRITNTKVIGEVAYAMIDIPSGTLSQYGNKQLGFFVDFVQPVINRKVLEWNNATINVACRFEYVDYNIGNFVETNSNVFDDIKAVVPSISFRPSKQTVIRMNYRYHWERDVIGNPYIRTAGFQFGFSSYF